MLVAQGVRRRIGARDDLAPTGDHPICRADLGRDDLTGLTLGQYDLGRRLGAGGMGLVYEAKHRHLGKSFAVKFIRNEVCSAEATTRFIQEIRTLGTLQHVNVINAVDAGVQQHLPFCVTELLAGHDLASWMELRGPLPPAAAAEAIRQAAHGLASAHEQNIIHRDIKPSNLFLQFDGTVKLLDFGISVSEGASQAATEPGRLLGTIDFMSPEQIHDAHSVTAASDLYSLGASLFFLMTGKLLYDDAQYPSTVNKLRAMGQASDLLLQPHESRIPAAIRPLLSNLLSPNPAERLASAALLRDQLAPLASFDALLAWSQGTNVCLPAVAPERSLSINHLRRSKLAGIGLAAATIVMGLSVAFYTATSEPTATSSGALQSDNVLGNASDIAETLVSHDSVQALEPAKTTTPVVAKPSDAPKKIAMNSAPSLERQTVSGSGRTTLSANAIDFSAASKMKRSTRGRMPAASHSQPIKTP